MVIKNDKLGGTDWINGDDPDEDNMNDTFNATVNTITLPAHEAITEGNACAIRGDSTIEKKINNKCLIITLRSNSIIILFYYQIWDLKAQFANFFVSRNLSGLLSTTVIILLPLLFSITDTKHNPAPSVCPVFNPKTFKNSPSNLFVLTKSCVIFPFVELIVIV